MLALLEELVKCALIGGLIGAVAWGIFAFKKRVAEPESKSLKK